MLKRLPHVLRGRRKGLRRDGDADHAYNFPVIREAIGHADALYGFKSGFDRESLALGVKSGGFWPGNMAKGLTNHQSTVFLFDADTGRCRADRRRQLADGASHGRRLRDLDQVPRAQGCQSARHDRRRPPVDLPVARRARPARASSVSSAWNLHPEMLGRLATEAQEHGLPFEAVDLDRLGAESDVIITITSSFAPILKAAQVKPGTHLACMGTDTKGKQEVEAELVAAATIFTDEVAQSITIGEAQHAVAKAF